MSESSSKKQSPQKQKRSGFPAGLRVLLVDNNAVHVGKVVSMLMQCGYKVTPTTKATDALEELRNKKDRKDSYDIVITEVQLPDMDGFELLKIINLELDIPVILMSANDETSSVMKGIKQGARDYLVKPVRLVELKNIWQHVLRKVTVDTSKLVPTSDEIIRKNLPLKKRRDKIPVDEEEQTSTPSDGDSSAAKRIRFNWPKELHDKFVNVFHALGADKVAPKKILEIMDEPQLTREIIASHLQKYRTFLQKQKGNTTTTSLEGNDISSSIRNQRDILNATSTIVSSYNQGLHPLGHTPAPSGLLPEQNILPSQISEKITPVVLIPAWLANAHSRPDINSQAPSIGAMESGLSHLTNFGDLSQPGSTSHTGLLAHCTSQENLSNASLALSSCSPPSCRNLGETLYNVVRDGSSQAFQTCQQDSGSVTVQISLAAKQDEVDINETSASITLETQPQFVDHSEVNGQINHTQPLTEDLNLENSQQNDA